MSNEFEDAVGGEGNSVTAAHEAGHALLAWLSPAVATVLGSVWIREEGSLKSVVRVRFAHRKPATTYTIWELAAVSAAGIAAELVTHQRFKTRPARSDLDALRLAAENLRRGHGSSMPVSPWPAPTAPNAPPFEKCFRDGPLEPVTAEIMRLAFLRARERILAHRQPYERLRTAMIVKIELTGEEIAAALAIPKG